jgi:hypothetical protein
MQKTVTGGFPIVSRCYVVYLYLCALLIQYLLIVTVFHRISLYFILFGVSISPFFDVMSLPPHMMVECKGRTITCEYMSVRNCILYIAWLN